MKKIILLLIISFSICAETTGDLDKTFSSKGLYIHFSPANIDIVNLASTIDSTGKLLVLMAYDIANEPNQTGLVIRRFLTSGAIDASFSHSPLQIDTSLLGGNFKLVIDNYNGVFLGYSDYTCAAPDTDCQQNIVIEHYNNQGTSTDSKTIAFDYGSTYLRQNDVFADMVFIPDDFGHNTRMLAIAATVDYSSVYDTDMGIALLDISSSGLLSLRTTFATGGKTTCAFDQDITHSGIGVDVAKSIVLESGTPLEFIVGGSAFEGNGSNSDGWNLAFCKLNVTGGNVQQFSTLPLADTLNDVEILQDMYYSNNGGEKLVVAAKFSTTNDNDFVIGEYLQSANNWQFNNSFATNGWASVGFNELFIGNTDDIIQTIIIEPDNDITVAGNMQWQDGGTNYSKIALARFDHLGVLKSNWGINGTKVHDFSGVAKTYLNDMVYYPYEKELYLVGFLPNTNNNKDAYAANILDNIDLIFLNSFE